MFKAAGPVSSVKAKQAEDSSSPFAFSPATFSVSNPFSGSDVTWTLDGAERRVGEFRATPQDVMTPPDVTSASDLDKPQENGNGDTTVAQGGTGDARIDGILSGVKWNATTIYYSDVNNTNDYQSGYFSDADGDGISAQNEGFSAFTAAQVLALHAALDSNTFTQLSAAKGFSIEGFTNLGIGYDGPSSSIATIRAANSSDAGTAYAYYPSSSIYGGDTFFGNTYDGTSNSLKNPVAGNYAWHTMIHELGHSLGLKHGQETGGPSNTALPTAYDSIEFSVMTYRSYVGAGTGGYTYEQWGAPQTYMMLDIAALQTMYGADYTANAGNTVYTWSPTLGETYINGALAIDPGANRIFATIWDGGGVDTYDLSNYTTNLSLDLNPGGYSLFSAGQQAYLGNGNYARGNIFNALLFGGNTASLIENANGGSGNDTIVGNQANNVLNGNGGNDNINGGEGNDTINGGIGNDTLDGGYGVDTIHGNDGNDVIYGGLEGDTVYGDAGDDTFIMRITGGIFEWGDTLDGGTGTDRLDLSLFTSTYGAIVNLATGSWQYNPLYGGPWTITGVENVDGTQLADTLTGNSANNVLNGNGGNDTIYGGTGNDTINGGNGDDLLLGDDGNDIISGGAGNDQLRGGGGNDVFDGGSGQDLFYGEAGNDTLKIVNGWNGGYGEIFAGGAGTDTFDFQGTNGLHGYVSLVDGVFEDSVFPGYGITLSSVENVIAGAGNDTLIGSAEANLLRGNGGNDSLSGLEGNDTLEGGDGNDILNGGTGNDTMTGGAGNDTYYVDSASDVVVEAANGGTDTIFSTLSYTLLSTVENLTLVSGHIDGTGNSGANILTGNSGMNVLKGGGGNDTLNGAGGSDTLDGGSGADILTGGTGADKFLFMNGLGGGNVDTITDYKVVDDTIQLNDAAFGGLALGTLSASAFFIGAAAADASDRIIYNSATGALLFDADGNGAGAAIQFATLSTGLAMTAAEFVVI
ncbi:M10 family metallopeptidase C-terminal domain-containing protein [Sphingobium ummariense]